MFVHFSSQSGSVIWKSFQIAATLIILRLKLNYDGLKMLWILSNAFWLQSLHSWTQQNSAVSLMWWAWSFFCTARSSYRSSDSPVTAASLDSGLSGSAYSLLDEEGETNEVDSAIFQVPRLWVNLYCKLLPDTYLYSKQNMCSTVMLCSYVISMMSFPFSLVERSQMAQTWWNHQWDTVTWKVRQRHLFDITVT